jgi:hypothetical protein
MGHLYHGYVSHNQMVIIKKNQGFLAISAQPSHGRGPNNGTHRSRGQLNSLLRPFCGNRAGRTTALDWPTSMEIPYKCYNIYSYLSGWWLSHPSEKYESQLGL